MCIFTRLRASRAARSTPIDRLQVDLRLRFENELKANVSGPETPASPAGVGTPPIQPPSIKPIVAFAHEEPDIDVNAMTPAEQRRLVDAYLRHRATVSAIGKVATDRTAAAFLAPFAEASSRQGRDVMYDIAQRQRFERYLRGEAGVE